MIHQMVRTQVRKCTAKSPTSCKMRSSIASGVIKLPVPTFIMILHPICLKNFTDIRDIVSTREKVSTFFNPISASWSVSHGKQISEDIGATSVFFFSPGDNQFPVELGTNPFIYQLSIHSFIYLSILPITATESKLIDEP